MKQLRALGRSLDEIDHELEDLASGLPSGWLNAPVPRVTLATVEAAFEALEPDAPVSSIISWGPTEVIEEAPPPASVAPEAIVETVVATAPEAVVEAAPEAVVTTAPEPRSLSETQSFFEEFVANLEAPAEVRSLSETQPLFEELVASLDAPVAPSALAAAVASGAADSVAAASQPLSDLPLSLDLGSDGDGGVSIDTDALLFEEERASEPAPMPTPQGASRAEAVAPQAHNFELDLSEFLGPEGRPPSQRPPPLLRPAPPPPRARRSAAPPPVPRAAPPPLRKAPEPDEIELLDVQEIEDLHPSGPPPPNDSKSNVAR